MHVIRCASDMAVVRQQIDRVTLATIPDGAGSSHFGGPEGWIHGLSTAHIDTHSCPEVWEAICELQAELNLGDVEQVLLNCLQAGAEFGRHRDGLPDNARFHLPIQTTDSAWWWDELNGTVHMRQGYWYGPMPYCGILHAVGNPSENDRIHLIVDFKRKGK